MASDTQTRPDPPATAPPIRSGSSGPGERVFRALVHAAGGLILLLLAAIAAFLVVKAVPAIKADTVNFITEKKWFPDSDPSVWGILALAWGTLLTSVIALLLAVPVAIGVALFITEYAPRRLAQGLAYVVDLLAAVPSIVYGLWGVFFLVPHINGLSGWLTHYLGWIPLFASESNVYGRSIFTASVVLAVMVLPIIAALSREVFLQTPLANKEAALALGATRWEMIRYSVLPFGRPGVIGAVLLGLGRALGETIAIAVVLAANFDIVVRILEPGGNTIAANIANQFAEAGEIGRGALIASGLVLFAITFVVNLAARAIIARRAAFAEVSA
ncbi:MAG: phosphate ABC transporter permease subunit PstC [Motilibacteraceae bacterium]